MSERCGHCGHTRMEHYPPEDMRTAGAWEATEPGSCRHLEYANGPRCPCALWVRPAQSTMPTGDDPSSRQTEV